jgi:hypothetical protein
MLTLSWHEKSTVQFESKVLRFLFFILRFVSVRVLNTEEKKTEMFL